MSKLSSAQKETIASDRKRLYNRPVKSRLKTLVTKALASIGAGETEKAAKDVKAAISSLDQAAKKGIIHSNNSSRHKSRLMKKLNNASKAAPPPAPEKPSARRTRKKATS